MVELSAGPDHKERDEAQRNVAEHALRLLTVALARARQALLWERLWPVLAATAVGAGLFLAASWAGLWLQLPPVGRIVGLVLFGAILLASLIPALWLRLPRTADALRRLDHASGLDHRPATALTDELATRDDDPVADALWRAHLVRAADAARRLRAGWPQPHLPVRDPYAIRALVLLAVVTTFFMAEGERMKRITAAFDWSGVIAPRLYRVDAWVTPPAYTGRPPILLPGIRHDAPAPGETAVSVPTGSQVIVRSTGLRSLDLAMTGGLAEEANDSPNGVAEGGIERRFKITDHGSLSIGGLPAGPVSWGFRAVPDRTPIIAHSRDPETVGQSALSLGYRIEDDYGVVSAEARFTRAADPAGAGASAPRPLVAPPDFPLALPQARTRAGVGQTTKDLTEHPWAGADAVVVLAARDEGGNEGTSEPRKIRLPERSFTKPVARALVEQRRELAFDANARGRVDRALEALLLAPERFTPEPQVYLGLRTAATRLRLATTDDDLRSVIDYLWEIAVLIEDGTMSDAERELRAAQNALREALERGAGEEEIGKLTEALRQALDRFMRALAEQLRRDGTTEARPLDRNARILRPQDLKSMLDRIEKLARSGARDAARRLLDELQAMLDGLSRNRQARGDPNSGDMGGMLDQLGRMIQEQQRLRDRTYRQGRDSRGERRNRGPEQGMSERERRSFGNLRQDQEGLRQTLERMLQQLRRQGQAPPEEGGDQGGEEAGEALGRAEQAMRDAEGALGDGDADSAVEGQGRALQNLRRGAQGLAQSMQGGPGEGYGEPGGPEAEAAERTDPLGRPVRSREYGDDFSVKVPDEIDVQRARRVLEELRRRLGEPDRPRLELDYLERLLRDF
jgi:uncharacterized protein (TIGR02302 family)